MKDGYVLQSQLDPSFLVMILYMEVYIHKALVFTQQTTILHAQELSESQQPWVQGKSEVRRQALRNARVMFICASFLKTKQIHVASKPFLR